MSATTQISWTDHTWNPVVGCTKVSQGCKNCYAKALHDQRHRAFLKGKLQTIPQYAEPFGVVQTVPARLDRPLRWQRPSRIFSDIGFQPWSQRCRKMNGLPPTPPNGGCLLNRITRSGDSETRTEVPT